MQKLETVIIGAGPAGLKAAETLAKKGKKVIVFERKKIIGDKVCAGGLTFKDTKQFKIPDRIFERKFKKIYINTPHQRTELKFKEPLVYTVKRTRFGQWLAQKAGAEIQTNSPIEKIKPNSVIVNGKEIGFKYLIGADGSPSIVRSYLGLKTEKILQAFQYIIPEKVKNLELFIDIKKFGLTYAWIFPYKNTVSIGSGADLSKQAQKFIKMQKVKKNFDKWCKKRFDISNAEFQAHTICGDFKGYKFKNIFLAGDAGGFSSMTTGEGMYQAMVSGIDIAKKILNPNYKCKNIERLLKLKNIEDKILRLTESNKTFAKIEIEILAFLAKSNWFDHKLIKKYFNEDIR